MTKNNENESIERVWDFGIGFGYGNSSNPFVGSDDIPNHITLDVSIYGKRFFFDNGELGFTIVDKANFGINIIGTYNSERIYYSFLNDIGINLISSEAGLSIAGNNPLAVISDNSVLTSLPDIVPLEPGLNPFAFGNVFAPFSIPDKDLAVNLGLEMLYNTDYGNFSLQATKDASNTHLGADMIFEFSKSWQRNQWRFSSIVGGHWKSSRLLNYYYGVDRQSNPYFDLNYQPKSGIDTFINLVANYRLTNHLSLVASIKHTNLSSSIKNSPIINESSKSIVFTGLYYRF